MEKILKVDIMLLHITIFSFISGMFFGFLAWLLRFKENIIKRDKKTIRILATSYTLISGLVSATVTAYMIIILNIHPIFSILVGSVASLFTKILLQVIEHNLININLTKKVNRSVNDRLK